MVREFAFKIIKNFDKRKLISKVMLDDSSKLLKKEEYNNLMNLVWGTIRNITLIDYIMSKLVKNYNTLPPAAKSSLRLGAFQIIDGYEHYAAINETVKILNNKKTKNFVNAVLRNFINEIKKYETFPEYVKYSFPVEYYEYIKNKLPFYEKIIMNHKKPPILCIRVNNLLTNKKYLYDYFLKKGFDPEYSKNLKDSIKLNNVKINLEREELYLKGYYYIQNESSQAISLILSPERGDSIYDCCAAPGGKTTYIGELMENTGLIHTNEIDIIRNENLIKNINRHKINICEHYLISADKFKSNLKYDKILIDAPCSSLGTSNKNPEVLLRQNLKDTYKYCEIQKNIIKNSFNHIKDGGIIVYSTCTFTKHENSDIMNWVEKEFKNHFDVEFINISKNLDALNISYYYDKKGFYFIPDETISLFYVCKMRIRRKLNDNKEHIKL